MMNILLVEDELPAYRRLQKLLHQQLPNAQISEQVESISGAISYFQNKPEPDLIFMDIQLADGLSFSIFETVEIQSPIIFTTAFDQYTLRAFKVHSIDYLLKPIEEEALAAAIQKYERFFQKQDQVPTQMIQQLVQQMERPSYRERFLVKTGNSLAYLQADEIAYFYSDQSLVFARKKDQKQHHIDASLDQLEQQLDPKQFFRISRKAIVNVDAIQKIDTYFNGRLLLHLNPVCDFQSTVSRDRVGAFKAWLDR
ncbi:MAG: LytTR family DNA-binding domain-containing protein [Bacteroidota bacterium]